MDAKELDELLTRGVIELAGNGCLTVIVMIVAGGLWTVVVLMLGAVFL